MTIPLIVPIIAGAMLILSIWLGFIAWAANEDHAILAWIAATPFVMAIPIALVWLLLTLWVWSYRLFGQLLEYST